MKSIFKNVKIQKKVLNQKISYLKKSKLIRNSSFLIIDSRKTLTGKLYSYNKIILTKIFKKKILFIYF